MFWVVFIGLAAIVVGLALAMVVLFYGGWGLSLLVSALYRRLPVGWDERGQSAPGRWVDRHDTQLAVGLSVAIGAAALVLVFGVVPRWDADSDRMAPRELVEAWGRGGKEAAYAWYDHRAEFRDVFFETYSPTGAVDVKDDGEGVFDAFEFGSSKLVKTKRYAVTTAATREGEPRTLELRVSVAKDSHKVCAVESLTEDVPLWMPLSWARDRDSNRAPSRVRLDGAGRSGFDNGGFGWGL